VSSFSSSSVYINRTHLTMLQFFVTEILKFLFPLQSSIHVLQCNKCIYLLWFTGVVWQMKSLLLTHTQTPTTKPLKMTYKKVSQKNHTLVSVNPRNVDHFPAEVADVIVSESDDLTSYKANCLHYLKQFIFMLLSIYRWSLWEGSHNYCYIIIMARCKCSLCCYRLQTADRSVK